MIRRSNENQTMDRNRRLHHVRLASKRSCMLTGGHCTLLFMQGITLEAIESHNLVSNSNITPTAPKLKQSVTHPPTHKLISWLTNCQNIPFFILTVCFYFSKCTTNKAQRIFKFWPRSSVTSLWLQTSCADLLMQLHSSQDETSMIHYQTGVLHVNR